MSVKNGNFFGLFGYQDSSNSKNYGIDNEDELEEGQIKDDVEQDNLGDISEKFNVLVQNYNNEKSQKISLKSAKNCFLCNQNTSKYTCPKCAIRTCSLNCCLLHKKKYSCNGIRDQLSFVPLKHYSHDNFNSDYKFLEKTEDALNNSSRFIENNSKKVVSNWFNKLIEEAAKRKIRYKKMPPSFKKARLNKSIYLYKEKTILWDIEFIMPHCLGNAIVNEGETIEECNRINYDKAYTELYHPFNFKRQRISEKTILNQLVDTILNKNDLIQELEDCQVDISTVNFMPYQKVFPNEILVLFKHDSGKFYYELDGNKSLLENFADKTIVEYPTLIIILKQFKNNYNIQM